MATDDRITFEMPDGWRIHAAGGAGEDMAYMIVDGPGEDSSESGLSNYFDALIITPMAPIEPDEIEALAMYTPEELLYFGNPRILIHGPQGGDPVLVLSMRGDKLVITEMDNKVVICDRACRNAYSPF